MTQNLDLGDENSRVLTSDDTDLADGQSFSLPASSTTWDYGTTPSINDPGNKYLPNGDTEPAQDISCTNKDNDGENCHYHIGNQYDYYAATAGSNNGSDAPYSICPKGWKLPRTNNSDDGATNNFYNLFKHYIDGTWTTNHWDGFTLSKLTSAPLFTTLSGQYDQTTNQIIGLSTFTAWISRNEHGSFAESLRLSASTLYPNGANGQKYGTSIRCVAR